MGENDLKVKLNKELARKTAQELQDFENKLRQCSKEQIMAQTEKLTILRQFQRLFDKNELSVKEALLISSGECPLAELYEEWRQNVDPSDALRDIMSSYIAGLRKKASK